KGIDERDLHALVGRQERGSVAAWASTQDDQLGFRSFRHGSPFKELGEPGALALGGGVGCRAALPPGANAPGSPQYLGSLSVQQHHQRILLHFRKPVRKPRGNRSVAYAAPI